MNELRFDWVVIQRIEEDEISANLKPLLSIAAAMTPGNP